MRRRATYAVLIALAAALLVSVAAAQEHAPPQGEAPAHATPGSPAGQAAGEGAPAHGSQEAAEDDAHAAFKYSAMVQKLSKWLGVSVETAYWISVGLNFAVIFVLIALVMRAKMPGAFAARTAAIQKHMEEARKASEEAGRRLGEIEGRLARLDSEIAGLKASAEAEARAEEERLHAAAEEERQKIVQGAEQEIAAAARMARTDLKAYVAELAVGLAEKRIEVGPAADKELVRSFVGKLGEDGK